MKTWILRFLIALTALVTSMGASATEKSPLCRGKFMNMISDVCWECVFPISIGAAQIAIGGQKDIENPASPICMCKFPVPGLSIGFWEPARTVEVVRYPYCMVSLGGINIDTGGSPVTHGREGRLRDEANGGPGWSIYQVHVYETPLLGVLGLGFDGICSSSGGIDLNFMTELDPSWDDDELAAVIAPDEALFATPVAQLACLADCAMANMSFGIQEMYWCAGCNGSLFPLNGHVQYHVSGAQASSLLMQRFLTKMHRLGLAKRYHGSQALCGPVNDMIMDKRAYKSNMTYPIPYTSGCQPLGRTTAIWATGKEFPIAGEDFAYILFRKRNCCAY